MFKKNELENEIKDRKSKLQTFVAQISRVEPAFQSLERIDQLCKEKGIQGYLGKLIDFIDCQSHQLIPCIDIASSKKLMAVVVDTLETA